MYCPRANKLLPTTKFSILVQVLSPSPDPSEASALTELTLGFSVNTSTRERSNLPDLIQSVLPSITLDLLDPPPSGAAISTSGDTPNSPPSTARIIDGSLVAVGNPAVEVTSELAILMATAMALGAYRSDIDQTIYWDGSGKPITTRTSITIDFSNTWQPEMSAYVPVPGMPLDEAVRLLLAGVVPRSQGAPESPPSFSGTRSSSPVDDSLCDACLAKALISSTLDCDCILEENS
ncbi:hypothetical protein FIBSPDRAFT_901027 [Athelia psychrophila]|uniref:Uncharacterized protein n=1 Tax=Athelia psychrophila TaxID=1759441 RepID=A0A167VV68_9AGAM|nr:hypothetical protein FIBSPDRAFT_903526 [Fibularhizoctonia sp. CBS 109695]KZP08703.1 hypothetical protein FIBSPDRAFT_901027 [Fibularhizoctonia sp. CBS 109695]